MACFRWLQRFRHSRGYGVHSPFAFDLIRKVLSPQIHYYFFEEMADHLATNYPHIPQHSSINNLSFKLIHRFKAKKILEIGAGYGVNTLFLISPDGGIHCTCVERRSDRVALARELTATRSNQVLFLPELPREGLFDAIVIHPDADPYPPIELLLQFSHEETFWIIDRVNSRGSKQFWHNIVNDERIGITFDVDNIGLLFLRHTYCKMHVDL